ncbi:alpha/beta hydrolase [[Hallella] seregens]|uniref:Alpha/beta hydrolase n=1 Tax=Hallella seregens ATCC 51272 TaxID=1336250 RepID=A0ABV5ZGS2_9BACT
MKKTTLSLLMLFICLWACAQDGTVMTLEYTSRVKQFNLWPDGAPNSNGITAPETDLGLYVANVTKPVLTVYVPKHPNGLAVIACPGGSYIHVWQGTEGHNMANWYNSHGVTYAVLKYRLPNGHCDVPVSDVYRAMKIMKAHSEELAVKRLGIQGCSAGGHLAATAATHYISQAERPDFQILFYPVISFDPAFTHKDSRDNLIGKNASELQVRLYSNELQVTADTPPAFIAASTDDTTVPVRNSMEYYNALLANNVPAALLLFPTGGHGWVGNIAFAYRQAWKQALATWLQQQSNEMKHVSLHWKSHSALTPLTK